MSRSSTGAARTRVLRLFAQRGLIPPEAAAEMRQWEHGGGFSLDAVVRIEATDAPCVTLDGNERARAERFYFKRECFAGEVHC